MKPLAKPGILASEFVKNAFGILMYFFIHFPLRSTSFGATGRFLICLASPRDQNTRFCEKSKYSGLWVRQKRIRNPHVFLYTLPPTLYELRRDRPLPHLFGLAQKPKYAGQQEVY